MKVPYKIMKAPYKIYVREYPDGTSRFWGIKRKDDVVATIQHEYIRKDALMKWLENKVSLSYGVATDALVEVIDKLNSL